MRVRGGLNRIKAALSPARHERYAFDYEHVLGTSFELRVSAGDAFGAARAEAAVLVEIDRLELILSGYSTASEFARWQATHDVDISVSPELAEVLDLTEQWRVRTNGAFNPAVRAIADALHDATDFASADVVTAAIVATMNAPLWTVDRTAARARRLTALPVTLDAIAKGFIVHRAARCGFDVPGVDDVLLNVGGDIQHFGSAPVAVGIANPVDASENARPIATVQIQNQALATSGGYRRGFYSGGEWHSHIVDPITRRPARGVVSASVIAGDAATADALSTAFSVLAPAQAIALAESFDGIGCLVMDESGAVWTNLVGNATQLRVRPANSRRASPQYSTSIPPMHTSRYDAAMSRRGLLARAAAGLVSYCGLTAFAGRLPTFGSAPKWDDNFELAVTFVLPQPQGGRYHRPYVAVWMEDPSGHAVRTLSLWVNRGGRGPRYFHELRRWFSAEQADQTAGGPDIVSTISSATRMAGSYSVTWNGRDDQGRVVDQGAYRLCIEAAREHGSYGLMQHDLELASTPKAADLPGNNEVASARVEYRRRK